MRLLLFSDLHLERGFAWAPPEVGRERRDALRRCLQRIAELAVQLAVDAVCCGGDLYEHDRYRPDTGTFLRDVFAGLDPIPVFVAPGNHDWLGPTSIYASTRWPPNVHIFTEQRLTPVSLADGLTLWGAAHHSPTSAPNLLDGFRVDRGGVHLALFHGSELGAFAPGGERAGESPQRHAPFRAEQIGAAGLHHALLGHFHTPRDAPDHTYPGNPEPLTFGETGDRGAVLITVDGSGSVQRQRHRVAATRLHDVTVDLDGVAHAEAVQDRVDAALAGVGGLVRVRLRGEVAPEVLVDPGRLRRPPAVTAWVVRAGEVTYGYDLAALRAEPTVRGQFVRDVEADPALSDEMRRAVLLTGLRAFDGREDLAVDIGDPDRAVV
ncbi:MAG: metallophosphoesterase [Micromonosporaceae bacterium]|nr:metallophosphoesterase [Micromonosporaceae bacterium]